MPCKEPLATLVECIRVRSYEGLDHQTLIDEMFLAHDLSQDKVDDLINEALDQGHIYEPILGHYKFNGGN